MWHLNQKLSKKLYFILFCKPLYKTIYRQKQLTKENMAFRIEVHTLLKTVNINSEVSHSDFSIYEYVVLHILQINCLGFVSKCILVFKTQWSHPLFEGHTSIFSCKFMTTSLVFTIWKKMYHNYWDVEFFNEFMYYFRSLWGIWGLGLVDLEFKCKQQHHSDSQRYGGKAFKIVTK